MNEMLSVSDIPLDIPTQSMPPDESVQPSENGYVLGKV